MLFINLVKIVIVITFKFCLKTQQTTHPIGGFPVFAANQISLREFKFCRRNLPWVIEKMGGS